MINTQSFNQQAERPLDTVPIPEVPQKGPRGHIPLLVLNGSPGNLSDPYGPRLIAAAIESENASVRLLQERLLGRTKLLDMLDRPPTSLAVFISAMPGTTDLANFIHRVSGNIGDHVPIVVGGVGAYGLSVAKLRVSNQLLIVRGQGENATKLVVRHLIEKGAISFPGLSTISNIEFRDGENIGRTEDDSKARLVNLCPSPVELGEAIRRGDSISVSTSSGCNGSCTFCSIRKVERTCGWRPRPSWVVREWLELIHSAGGRGIIVDIIDDALATDITHLEKVVKSFEEVNARLDADLKFRLSTRVDHLVDIRDSDTARKHRHQVWDRAAKAGLRSVFLGVESGSNSQLHRLGKGTTSDMNLRAIDRLRSLGVGVEIGFIAVDPLMPSENWRDEMAENLRMANYARVWQTCPTWLAPLRVYSGSRIARKLDRLGLLRTPIGETGEFQFEYASSEVRDFVRDLGPVFCTNNNPLRELKRRAKIAQRYGGMGLPISNAVESIIRLELSFVAALVEGNGHEAVVAAQQEFNSRVLGVLEEIASIAALTKQRDLILEIVAVRRQLSVWINSVNITPTRPPGTAGMGVCQVQSSRIVDRGCVNRTV